MSGVTQDGILKVDDGGGGGSSTTVAIGQPINATDASVLNSVPIGTEYGLAVRLVGATGGGGPATIADGADVNAGATTDAAVITDTTGTLSAKLRGLVKWAFERMPASLGQKLMSASFPIVIASDQSTINTNANVTGTVAVSNFPATQPISAVALPLPAGAATSALQTTGNNSLANIDADLDVALSTRLAEATFTGRINTLGQKTMANSTPVVLPSDQSAIPVNQGTAAAVTAGWPVNLGYSAVSGTTVWNSGTAANATIVNDVRGYGSVGFLFNVTSVLPSTAQILIEGSVDGGTTYHRISGKRYNDSVQGLAPVPQSTPIDIGGVPLTSFIFVVDVAGLTHIRLLWVAAIGSGSVSITSVSSARPATNTEVASNRIWGGNFNSIFTSTPVFVTATTDGVKQRLDVIASSKIDLTPAAPTAFSVGVVTATAVAANANRKGLKLINTSNAIISLGFGNAAVLNSGVTLLPYGVFEMDEYDYDLGSVDAIASAAASNLAIQEYTT
jgi:hypothetical protein